MGTIFPEFLPVGVNLYPLHLTVSFPRYKILGSHFIFLSVLNIVLYLLMARVAIKKLTIIQFSESCAIFA